MFDKFFENYFTEKNIVFFIIALLFLAFIVKIKDIAILFFASYVISCSLNPIVNKLSKYFSRGISAAIVLCSTLFLLGIFFIPIIILSGHEIKSFINHIPSYIDSIKTFIETLPFIDKTQDVGINLVDFLSSTTDVTTGFLHKSINFSVSFASAIIYIIAAILIIYYFLVDKDVVKKTYMSLFPAQMKEKAESIIETISNKIGGYVIAQLATMSGVGIIMTIGLMICGIEYALLLGLITAVLDIIPVVGPAIALIICLITTFKSGWIAMGLVILVFAIAQIVENNLIRPYIFGKILDLHPLIIYLFLFITAQYLGVVGVIFAPAIAATVCVLIEELYIKSIN